MKEDDYNTWYLLFSISIFTYSIIILLLFYLFLTVLLIRNYSSNFIFSNFVKKTKESQILNFLCLYFYCLCIFILIFRYYKGVFLGSSNKSVARNLIPIHPISTF